MSTTDSTITLKSSEQLIKECLKNINNLEAIVKRVPTALKLEDLPPFIINWHDQWEKYGLSYELSTSQLGFNLKNGAYLLSQMESNTHHYLKAQSPTSQIYSVQSFKLNSCPPNLIKYFRLNLKLKTFLQKNFKRSPLKNPSKKLIVVKKFIKFEFGIVFILSNNWIQYNCWGDGDHLKWVFKQDFSKVFGIDSNYNVLGWNFGNSELVSEDGLEGNQLYMKLKPCVNIFNWILNNK
jgi:hypothetical protein